AFKEIGTPTSPRIPTSKGTPESTDALDNINAHVCPARGLEKILPRFVLNSAFRCDTRQISSREVCSKLSRCFISLPQIYTDETQMPKEIVFRFVKICFHLWLTLLCKIDNHILDRLQAFLGFAPAQI